MAVKFLTKISGTLVFVSLLGLTPSVAAGGSGGSDELEAKVNAASSFLAKGNFSDAMAGFKESLAESEKQHSTRYMAISLMNLWNIYQKTEDLDNQYKVGMPALKLCSSGEDVQESYKEMQTCLKYATDTARALQKSGKDSQAEDIYDQAIVQTKQMLERIKSVHSEIVEDIKNAGPVSKPDAVRMLRMEAVLPPQPFDALLRGYAYFLQKQSRTDDAAAISTEAEAYLRQEERFQLLVQEKYPQIETGSREISAGD